MFDFFRKHMRLMQFALMLPILPSFVFFGIQGYSRFGQGGNATVATVAGQTITQAELDAAHREQVERLRRQMPNVDAKLLTPEMQQRTLDEMVRDRVTPRRRRAAQPRDHRRPAAACSSTTRGSPSCATRTAASTRRRWRSRACRPEMFAQRLAQDLSRRQVLFGVTGTTLAPTGGERGGDGRAAAAARCR